MKPKLLISSKLHRICRENRAAASLLSGARVETPDERSETPRIENERASRRRSGNEREPPTITLTY